MYVLPKRLDSVNINVRLDIKSKKSPGTEEIRTKGQPSKPKWEITISQHTKRAYDKPNVYLSPKRWLLNYLNLTLIHPVTQKVKTVLKLTPESKHREPNQKYRIGTVSNIKYYWGRGGGGLKSFKRVPNLAFSF